MAIVIVLVGCYYGYNASGGPVGVGTATAKSMVLNIVSVHLIGMLGTQLFWGANPEHQSEAKWVCSSKDKRCRRQLRASSPGADREQQRRQSARAGRSPQHRRSERGEQRRSPRRRGRAEPAGARGADQERGARRRRDRGDPDVGGVARGRGGRSEAEAQDGGADGEHAAAARGSRSSTSHRRVPSRPAAPPTRSTSGTPTRCIPRVAPTRSSSSTPTRPSAARTSSAD